MNFERGKKPKDSMKIGIGARAVWLRGIYERPKRVSLSKEEIGFQIINGPDGHSIFKDISKNGLQKRHEKYWVHLGSGFGYLPIDMFVGKWIEYLKTYYYIPKDEI